MPGYYIRSTAPKAAVQVAAAVQSAATVDGVTPASDNATAVTDTVTNGTLCEIGSYNSGYNSATSCTPCPENMVTINKGSKSESSCFAPPGVGYDPDTEPKAQPCPVGWYKEGFNRKACVPCGSGFSSDFDGTAAKTGCYIPAGFGTVETLAEDGSKVVSAARCLDGTFGSESKTYGVFSLPCRGCQAGMSTLDANPALSALDKEVLLNRRPDDCYTLPGYGYDSRSQSAQRCYQGSYSAGWDRELCSFCAEGYTTPEEGAISSDQCVIAPGWHLEVKQGEKPLPCDYGYYCPGMSLTATAVVCPEGTTNTRLMATSVAECDGEWGGGQGVGRGSGGWVAMAGREGGQGVGGGGGREWRAGVVGCEGGGVGGGRGGRPGGRGGRGWLNVMVSGCSTQGFWVHQSSLLFLPGPNSSRGIGREVEAGVGGCRGKTSRCRWWIRQITSD